MVDAGDTDIWQRRACKDHWPWSEVTVTLLMICGCDELVTAWTKLRETTFHLLLLLLYHPCLSYCCCCCCCCCWCKFESIIVTFQRRLVTHFNVVCSSSWLCSWLRSTVGGTPVFGVRTDPVLCSIFRGRVTIMWVNRLLKISQLGQLSLLSFWGR